jgi:hypothetical protein
MNNKKQFEIEIDNIYKGYQYVCIGNFLNGFRCGYVKIPETSIFFKKYYSDSIKYLEKNSDLLLFIDDKIDMSPESIFTVHGDITYSGEGYFFKNKNDWWLGFDCGHVSDQYDIDLLEKYYTNKEIIKMENNKIYNPENYTVKTKEFVEKECKSLINQIKTIEKLLKEKINE